MKISHFLDYAWHLYLCWQTRRRGELCEAVSFEEMSSPPTQTLRTCAACHAILADGPQPACTYPLSSQDQGTKNG